ncbi:unnamed protein product [Polarella glacialis]|uniref:SET domain-containing protein n=1 Tax=Polarella glacialis TaxID=89957 RepID=A0A813DNY1_POLGL|nr:unnamed protein product [Polarella glacialis]
MRARKAIAAGDEITVSYLAEEALLESTASRRTQLEATKHFLCNCGTCSATLDLVRGFACPGCKEGEVFLDVRGERPASAAQGACRRCGFLPDARQVSDLAKQEARIEELVQEWDRRMGKTGTGPENLLTDAIAAKMEQSFRGLFSARHWLRDRAAQHLVTYYEATGNAEKALPLAQGCASFAEEVYGFSALHAWALETQGDLQLKLLGFRLVSRTGVEAPASLAPEVLARAWREVGPVYMKASESLRALFGAEHEFFAILRDKRDALAKVTTTQKLGTGHLSVAN